MFYKYFLILLSLKILLIPSYFSTDFEVHRNWLAITSSLPITKWYHENTSIWTLDYPPFFAYFEWCLSKVAYLIDKEMLNIKNLNYASEMTILFQRGSVIFLDLVYAYGIKRCLDAMPKTAKNKEKHFIAALLLGNIGLLMVDHVHFQYNSFLFGILLLSIANVIENKFVKSAFWFAVLLNMKHIYLYIAPAYAICFFKMYSLSGGWANFSVKRLLLRTASLGIIVISVTIVSFGPFLNDLNQITQRLFPFKRGLSHAYWAPNFWALYNFADKVMGILWKKSSRNQSTSGLVQNFEHDILPTITPIHTFILTLITMLPFLIKVMFIKNKTKDNYVIFIKTIVLCGFCSFLFGWHVHEKAILLITIPLVLLTFVDDFNGHTNLLMNIIVGYSLFPLLYPDELTNVKLCLLLLSTFLSIYVYKTIKQKKIFEIFGIFEIVYISGFMGLFMYENFIQYLLNLHEKLPFVPLMLTSVYCSFGVMYVWLRYSYRFLMSK